MLVEQAPAPPKVLFWDPKGQRISAEGVRPGPFAPLLGAHAVPAGVERGVRRGGVTGVSFLATQGLARSGEASRSGKEVLRRVTPQPDTGNVNSSLALHGDESQAIRKVVLRIEQAILLKRVRAATGGAQPALSLIEIEDHLVARLEFESVPGTK